MARELQPAVRTLLRLHADREARCREEVVVGVVSPLEVGRATVRKVEVPTWTSVRACVRACVRRVHAYDCATATAWRGICIVHTGPFLPRRARMAAGASPSRKQKG